MKKYGRPRRVYRKQRAIRLKNSVVFFLWNGCYNKDGQKKIIPGYKHGSVRASKKKYNPLFRAISLYHDFGKDGRSEQFWKRRLQSQPKEVQDIFFSDELEEFFC